MPQARSLDFPWPSTIAGLARTQAGRDRDGHFDTTRIPELLAQEVAGPWLTEIDTAGNATSVAFPAPRDAVAFRAADGVVSIHRLAPGAFVAGAGSSLPPGMQPVMFVGEVPAGKATAGPAFWRWRELEPWLLQGRAPPPNFGIAALEHERRFHVAIDPQTGTAADGKLFASDGLRFWNLTPTSLENQRLALGFSTGEALSLRADAVKLGGEGRISYLRDGGRAFPSCPAALLDTLARTRRGRVVLATPGIFDNGSVPRTATIFGATILATRVDRPAVISGWDHASDQPKPSRRMAPAGSVYWVDLSGIPDMGAWLSSAWGRPVQEQADQDRRDGFGLALVGGWT